MSDRFTTESRQLRLHILTYIEDYMSVHQGKAPTVIEIKEALGLKSKGHAYYYLKCLAEEGRLHLEKEGRSRGITLAHVIVGRVVSQRAGRLTVLFIHQGKRYWAKAVPEDMS